MVHPQTADSRPNKFNQIQLIQMQHKVQKRCKLAVLESKNQFVDSWVEKAAWVCRLHMAFYLTNHQYIVLLHIHNHVLRLVGYLETHPGSAIRIIQNSLSRIFPLDSPIRLESSMSRFDKTSQQCLICEVCGNFGLFDPLATFRRRWHDLMC